MFFDDFQLLNDFDKSQLRNLFQKNRKYYPWVPEEDSALIKIIEFKYFLNK